MPIVDRWCPSLSCCDPIWEEAYQRFETPDQEIRKFRKRLISAGALQWPRDARVLELCCGRGNGLKALASLGFSRLEGVDLSEQLLQDYEGQADLYVGDIRDLKLPDSSVDIAIVQGGLHHLPEVLHDLEATLHEVRRVLRPGGRFVVVEPWNTSFLKMVHACCAMPLARRTWHRLDALATMIERERSTYESWLGHPVPILRLLRSQFVVEREAISWGKLTFVGRPAPRPVTSQQPGYQW
jgi:ubiquinone/menaquinone biosynthesis C-methylase UbiE